MSADAPILRYRGASIAISGARGTSWPVRGVDLDVRRDEVVALVGESGSGKSLTALSALGLLPPGARFEAQTAELNGRPLKGLSQAEWRRLRGSEVGIVFQEPLSSLNPVLTVGDQIGEVLKYKFGLPPLQRRARVVELLASLEIQRPELVHDSYPHQLSGGMRQRVLMAIALAGEPSLLIADEPTTALDSSVQIQVLDLILRTAGRAGMGVLFITHDLSVVAHVADRVLVMKEGEVVERGAVQEIFHRPQHAYTRHLVSLAPRIPPIAQQGRAGRHGPLPAEPRSAGDSPALAQAALLVVEGVSKIYPARAGGSAQGPTVPALSDVSLSIAAGTTLGVVGESGSGKSTLARIVTGLTAPSSGHILFDGADISTLKPAEARALRRHIQMIFQDPYGSLNPRMRLKDIIIEPVLAHGLLRGRRAADVVAELLDAVGLAGHLAERYPHELSGGQRQRVGIARALSVRPKLVVCDEPISALDVSVQAQIMALLRDLQPTFGLTYLFIAHGLDSVYAISDRIAVMRQGRIVEKGDRDSVFGRPREPYTRSLLDAMLDADPTASRFRARPAFQPTG